MMQASVLYFAHEAVFVAFTVYLKYLYLYPIRRTWPYVIQLFYAKLN